MEPMGSSGLWGPSSVLEELLVQAAGGVNLPSPRGLSRPQTISQTGRHSGAVDGQGDGARGGDVSWLLRAMRSIGGPPLGDSWPKVPYVLLKDTAMVSTAFSNSRLSVSLLDS